MSANNDWHILEFYTPIENFAGVNHEFVIKGTAISECTTSNGHTYIAEELEKASSSLAGRPLLVDHDNRVESIKGRVTKSSWDPISHSIKFEAKIMDKNIKEMVSDGRLSQVSIGAYAEDLIREEETNSYVAKGLKIVELSLVAVPADSNASFSQAIDKSFQLKEAAKLTEEEMDKDMEKKKCPECGKMIQKDKMKQHMKDMHESFSQISLKGGLSDGMTEEIKNEQNAILEENKQLKAKVESFMKEKKDALVEKYKSVCKEKKLTAREVSNLSEDMINLLIEQAQEIKLAEVTPLKGQITPSTSLNWDGWVYEGATRGFWKMPDKRGKITID